MLEGGVGYARVMGGLARPSARFVVVAAFVAVGAVGCAGARARGPASAAADSPDEDIEVRWCERADATTFECARVSLPAHRFATDQSCNGLRFDTRAGPRCVQYERVPVADVPLVRPAPVGACGVWCGDRDGDRRYDRCLERLTCPRRADELSFAGRHAVRHPSVVFETLCAPLPKLAQDVVDTARAGQGDCDEAPLFWVVLPETMRHASDATGPGLCYGTVKDEGEPTKKESCGQHHCQTLRYCDGRERAQHCTVYARCRAGRFVPVGLGW